jgi:hypothetical protein
MAEEETTTPEPEKPAEPAPAEPMPEPSMPETPAPAAEPAPAATPTPEAPAAEPMPEPSMPETPAPAPSGEGGTIWIIVAWAGLLFTGFIAPLLVWLLSKNPRVKRHGKIATIVGGVITLLAILGVVFVIPLMLGI